MLNFLEEQSFLSTFNSLICIFRTQPYSHICQVRHAQKDKFYYISMASAKLKKRSAYFRILYNKKEIKEDGKETKGTERSNISAQSIYQEQQKLKTTQGKKTKTKLFLVWMTAQQCLVGGIMEISRWNSENRSCVLERVRETHTQNECERERERSREGVRERGRERDKERTRKREC